MKKENSLSAPAQEQDELTFLPAALEIQQTPPSRYSRVIALTIGVFFCLLILWSYFGTVDVIATFQGKTLPIGKVKVVQPREAGVVRAIHVEEGQKVQKGDLIIELDSTETKANVASLIFDLGLSRLNAAFAEAQLSEEPDEVFTAVSDLDPELVDAAERLFHDQQQRLQAQLDGIEAEITRTKAEIRDAVIENDALEKTIPMVQERLKSQEKMLKEGYSSKFDVLSLRQQLHEYTAMLESTLEAHTRGTASVKSLKAKYEEIQADYQARAGQKRLDAMKQIELFQQSLKKEQQRLLYQSLRAPVTGFVQQLNIHTIGGVVHSADELMIIVPQDIPLEIEAFILNKDVGFVAAGQEAEIKFEAFPFTRYGTVIGTLAELSSDAIAHPDLGPVYKAKITLDQQSIDIEGKKISLSPGMNATVEVKTGKRRIIEFFLSPLLRYQDEAIRER